MNIFMKENIIYSFPLCTAFFQHLIDGLSRELLGFSQPLDQDQNWRGPPHPTQKLKEKNVLKWLFRQNPVF